MTKIATGALAAALEARPKRKPPTKAERNRARALMMKKKKAKAANTKVGGRLINNSGPSTKDPKGPKVNGPKGPRPKANSGNDYSGPKKPVNKKAQAARNKRARARRARK